MIKFIAGMLLSCSVMAEYELKINKMDYGLGTYGQYSFESYQVGFTKYLDNTGFKVLAGQSDKDSGQYMRNFWVMNIHQRIVAWGGYSFQIGYNYTEYKACGKWGCNPDTGHGLSLAVQKRISDRWALKYSIDDYYTKVNEWIGKERTTSTGLSLIAGF